MTSRSGNSHALTARGTLGAVPFQKTRPAARTSGFSQADMRRPALMYDQHGRQWSCWIENKSGMPTGLISNNFHAPWLPDQGALVVNPFDISELWIDYRAMYLERRNAMQAYHKLAVGLCADKKWEIPKLGYYSADIMRVLQDPPLPLQPVKAADAGNPWILGFTDVEDPRLVAFCRAPDSIDEDMDDDEDYSEEGFNAEVSEEEDEIIVDTGRRAPFVPPAALGMADLEDDEDAFDEVPAPVSRERAAPIVVPVPPELLAEADEYEPDDAGEDDAGEDEPVSLLDELEDEHDRDAVGGKTVQPGKANVVAAQAPRREGQVARSHKKKKGGNTKAREMKSIRAGRSGGPTGASLAGGARPAVSSASNEHEPLIRHRSEQ